MDVRPPDAASIRCGGGYPSTADKAEGEYLLLPLSTYSATGGLRQDPVGVGCFGGCDFTCEACRRGDFISCENGQVPGIAYDGGYGEYMVAPAEALARIPDDLSDVDAAPLLCAGVTTFNALRESVARPGDLLAILGIGGLGHLGIQYAAKMGFEVTAIARGEEKGPLAK